VASDSFAPWTWRASAGSSIGQHSRAGTTATIETALPGRFVSICSRLVGNIGEAYTVADDPFGGCLCHLLAMGVLSNHVI
jgi:hypothetical protein